MNKNNFICEEGNYLDSCCQLNVLVKVIFEAQYS